MAEAETVVACGRIDAAVMVASPPLPNEASTKPPRVKRVATISDEEPPARIALPVRMIEPSSCTAIVTGDGSE